VATIESKRQPSSFFLPSAFFFSPPPLLEDEEIRSFFFFSDMSEIGGGAFVYRQLTGLYQTILYSEYPSFSPPFFLLSGGSLAMFFSFLSYLLIALVKIGIVALSFLAHRHGARNGDVQ